MTKCGILRFTTAIFFGVFGLGAATACAADLPIDLVTHNSILIQAPPSSIWPKILDPSEWKAGAKLVAIDAAPGQSGARFKAVMPDTPDEVAFYAREVEVLPERRRTMELRLPDESLIGYASWELTAQDNSTLVEYHVYSQVVIPEAALAGMSDADKAAFSAGYGPSNYKRFQSELETLKKLVENPGSE